MRNQALANLSALVESTEDLIWSVDLDWRLLAFNNSFSEGLKRNFHAQAVPGARPEDLLPPERAALWPPLYERVLREGPFRVEYLLPDGRTLELAFNPIEKSGKTVGISVFGKDVSQRRAAEMALKESENKYRGIFDGALEGIFQTALDGRILTANLALAKMLGYDSPDEIVAAIEDVSRDLWVDSNQRSRLIRLIEEQGFVRGFECQFKRKDGVVIWVSLNAGKTSGPDGRLRRLEGFVEDITERKRAAQELEESEARFRRFFEQNGSVMLILDPSRGKIVNASQAAAAFYGYPQKQLIGMAIDRINTLPPEQVAQEYLRAQREERTRFEFRHRLANGEERDVEVYSSPVHVDGRQFLFSIVHDISERKSMEEALRESLDSLEESQRIGGLGSYALDILSGAWSSSDVLDEIFGIGKDYEHTVEGWSALIHPEDREAMAAYFAGEVVAQGKPFNKEYRIVRQTDRAERWVHGLGKLEFDAAGAPLKMRGVIKDITEQKHAEMQIRESEERYRATFEQAAVGIIHTSLDGRVLRCNARFAEILGYPLEEVPGITFQQITLPEELGESTAMLQRLSDRLTDKASWEKRYIRKDGTLTWVKLTVSIQRDDQGRLLHFIVLAEDINARKAAEQRLAAVQQALRASEIHYRTIFQTSADGIAVSQMNAGRYLDVNKAFLDLMGYQREELLGHTSFELNFWVDSEARGRMITALREHAGFRDMQTQYRRKNGEIIWVTISASAIEIDGVPCILAVVRDITAAKAAEERLAAAQEALRASEEHYRTAFQTSHDGISITRLESGLYIDVNRAFLRIFGYTREEVIGRTSLDLHIWADPEDRRKMVAVLHKESICQEMEVRFRRKDGQIFWVLVSASVIQLDSVPCVLFVIRDISAAKAASERLAAAQDELRKSEERYRTAFQTSLDCITITRLSDGMYIDVNKAFLDVTGYELHEVIGRTSLELDFWENPRDRQKLLEILRAHPVCRNLEAQFRIKSGELFWGLMSASVIELDGVPCMLSITRDISDAKLAEDEIRNLAFYDPLTGLPNRRLLMERLHQTLVSGPRTPHKRALMFVDLDNFKNLNDTLGHQAGDLLLQKVAGRLSSCIRDADTVARLGGDEFVVMLEGLSECAEDAASQARAVAEKILAAIRQPCMLDGHEVFSTSSVGITVFGEQRQSMNEVMQQADIAMYQAKAAGRNTMRFFAPALQAAVNSRAALEEDLRHAIKTSQFQLYYQPQVDSGKLIGAEALIRWNHPARGILFPGKFISLAEETALILPLGNWVLETACQQIAVWAERKESAHIVLAVNISARQFRQPDFVEHVLEVLERTGANPRNLKLELTESMLVENIEDVIGIMANLKSHGVRFSLDDFGTGYSSLSYLKRLPLDQLKIDRSFVRDMLADANSGAIAQTLISLGRAMGLSVIAEGVETEEQRVLLTRMGCHSFQGFLFSQPLELEQFTRLWLDPEEAAAPVLR
jgi:diguanylate cyclase (GGDEF)-like protein/PAS domain S-box-containing protein